MKFYFAPMEGVTGYIYRNAHATFFNHVDKYFTPFIATNQHHKLTSRELNDILPEHNQGLVVIPQILSNNAEDFIKTVQELQVFGYNEVNLNLGCPSGTVVAKNKGAGFLAETEALDQFLETVFANATTKISIKTRIGKERPEEFNKLIQIFNQYPLEELIVHPRVQTDYYRNKPNWDSFNTGAVLSKNPIGYNGDLFSSKDYQTFTNQFPNIDTIMLGRGLIANPGLISEMKEQCPLDKKLLKAFHDRLYEDYQHILSGERNVLFKMKEVWFYMIHVFADSDKYAKKIKKSQRLKDYEQVVSSLFSEVAIVEGAALK